MACWSAENATRAYLKTMKMGKAAKEPDMAEFVSALAAGTNAQLMVVVGSSGRDACSTTLALVAAVHQTGGRVVCILPGLEDLTVFKNALGPGARHVEFVIGEAESLLKEADFVVIDCGLKNHEGIFRAVEGCEREKGAIVLGYNAFRKGTWSWGGSETQLLPIAGVAIDKNSCKSQAKKKKSLGCESR
ncbi:Receptor-type tyrosine-protein like [Actinidia chinensis var. chinensis]|uniref:Receptor-type tyrosine-protein like n=1 Tax=Actinidia chinensis var. chinensis TaxID=1590841 RepID=A0A2R6RQW5_ACTCC|nr:Receptor-type tyrosine-protein like [Actinidia chinensis var. chinensis]